MIENMGVFTSFWAVFLPLLANFLMSEPIIYFIGLAILAFVIGLILKLINR